LEAFADNRAAELRAIAPVLRNGDRMLPPFSSMEDLCVSAPELDFSELEP
jgi:hypothetical protein